MDVFKGYAAAVAKSQTKFGLFLFLVTLACWPTMISMMSDWYSKDKLAFKCTKATGSGDTVNARCYNLYSEVYNSPFSQMEFALVNGCVLIGMWVAYALYVSSKIRRYISRQDEIQQHATLNVFSSYLLHIFLRVVFLGLMISLLLCLQPFNKIPVTFTCSLKKQIQATNGSVSCTDAYRSEKSQANIAILAFDGALLFLSVCESAYLLTEIACRPRSVRDQRSNNDTFLSYVLDETEEDGPSLSLDQYIVLLREEVLEYTESEKATLPSDERSTIKMDDIYTTVIIQQGRASPKLDEMKRGDVLATYPEPTGIEVKNLEDIFQPKEDSRSPPKNILVSGRAGIGKSFVCRKLLRDWAKGDLFSETFTEHNGMFKFVTLLKFRQLNYLKMNLTLYDLLGASMLSSNLGPEVYKNIVQHPDQMLIIFDGLDEFDHYRNCAEDEQRYLNDTKQKMPVSALYGKIVSGKFLKGATIVTTSRPAALNFVGELDFERVVEILGFTPMQVQEYIERFCGHDETMCAAILRHVFGNDNILSLCYVPVNCKLICLYFQFKLSGGNLPQDSSNLPTTLTEMYEGVLQMFIIQHHHSCRREGIQDFSRFPHSVEETLNKLCALALQGIKQRKLIFLQDDLTSCGLTENDIQQLTKSGLLHCLPPVRSGPFRVDTQYCFIHLTLQEFLAAREVALTYSDEDIQSLSTSVMIGTDWDLVLQFFCGLQKTAPSVMTILNRLLLSSHSPGSGEPCELTPAPFPVNPTESGSSSYSRGSSALGSFDFDFDFDLDRKVLEDQEPTLSESSISCNVDTIRIRSEYEMQLLTMKCLYETRSLPMVITIRKTFPSEVINLSGLGITPGDCTAITFFLLGTHVSILQMANNTIGTSGCKTLSEGFALWDGPTELLDLANNSIGDDGAICLSKVLATGRLCPAILNLGRNGITAVGAKGLAEALRNPSSQVRDLNMGYNELGSDGAGIVSTLLNMPSSTLRCLGMAGNAIGDKGVVQISLSLLSGSCTLVDLDLRSNGIGSVGCSSLADVLLKPQCSLEALHLSGNPICNENQDGVRKMANSIGLGESSIRVLSLSECGIYPGTASFLSEALMSPLCKVRSIDLSFNHIGNAGCECLSAVVASSHSPVEKMNLDRNGISDEGARYFVRALNCCDSGFRSLFLSGNNISESVQVDLLNAWGDSRGKLYLI